MAPRRDAQEVWDVKVHSVSILPTNTPQREFVAALVREPPSYRSEVHDFEDPDCKSQVHYHGDEEKEDEEVQASLPPAVDPHCRVDLGAAHRRPPLVERVGLRREDILLLCHLEEGQSPNLYKPGGF